LQTKRWLNNRSMLALSSLVAVPFLAPQDATAHGYSTFPKARQLICAEEGGVWSGSPPMAGCATMKDISGTYPFVQINEVSINIPDYNNQATVEAAVPDGTLCHANDDRKRGLSATNNPAAWTRTTLQPGTFSYTFNATAPHNPSFWKFYITKQGTDLNQPLKWSDLELIKEDNGTTVESTYTTELTIPNDRSGDHILFVRWQRIDPVGEGFYNCSDITIDNGTVTTGPYLVQGAEYVLPAYQVGDRVVLDVLNKHGDVHNSFSIDVSAENVDFVPELLAADVSGYYESYHNGNVFIGGWHEEMEHYMYFLESTYPDATNYFNSKSADASYAVRIEQPSTGSLSVALKELESSDGEVLHGEYVSVLLDGDFDSFIVEELSAAGVGVSTVGDVAIVDTSSVPVAALPASVSLRVTTDPGLASEQQETVSFTVLGGEVAGVPVWDSSAVYVAGDVVSFGGGQWQAQWWVQGGDDPAAVYAGDIWGVWRPFTE